MRERKAAEKARLDAEIARDEARAEGVRPRGQQQVVLGKGAAALRTRQLGLATNTYTSFEADEPKRFKSGVQVEKPPTFLK